MNGSANYGFAVGDLTYVGSYTAKPSASAYLTLDQGGNVFEWNETVIGSYRGLRGGSFNYYDYNLHASYRGLNEPANEPANEYDYFGFRVAVVPEPATIVLLAFGAMGVLGRRRR